MKLLFPISLGAFQSVPRRRLGFGKLILGACCLMILTGCSGTAEEEEPSVMVEYSETIFPLMLHNQTIRHGNQTWRLRYKEISDLELHERTEASADGTRTATVSFTITSSRAKPRVKARITYRGVEGNAGENEQGVTSFPVTNIEVLSVNGS